MTHSQEHELFPSNFLLSFGSSAVAFFYTTLDPLVTAVLLPVVFFTVGKAIDVVVKLYLARRK